MAYEELKQLMMAGIDNFQATDILGVHFEEPPSLGPAEKKSRFADIEDSDNEEDQENITGSVIAQTELDRYLRAKPNELQFGSFLNHGIKLFLSIYIFSIRVNMTIIYFSIAFYRTWKRRLEI